MPALLRWSAWSRYWPATSPRGGGPRVGPARVRIGNTKKRPPRHEHPGTGFGNRRSVHLESFDDISIRVPHQGSQGRTTDIRSHNIVNVLLPTCKGRGAPRRHHPVLLAGH